MIDGRRITELGLEVSARVSAPPFPYGTGACWHLLPSPRGRGKSVDHPIKNGLVTYKGRRVLAWRLIYEHFVGPIPANLEPHRTCGDAACISPEHIELLPHAEVVARSLALKSKNRTHCRKGHELTPANTRIDKTGTRRCRQCAEEQRVHRRAKRGKNWHAR